MEYSQRSFSQRYGYEEIPARLKLEELPSEARIRIWNLFYASLKSSRLKLPRRNPVIGSPWGQIFLSLHTDFDCLPRDEWNPEFNYFCGDLRDRIESIPLFNRVFDMIEFVLSHPECPRQFVEQMNSTFEASRLAYTIDFGPPPSIVPAVTPEEGAAVIEALQSLRQAGLGGSATHLRNASARINEGKWADSIRESIHAVESVARQLDPDGARTLGPALNSIERRTPLHPALKSGFQKLYGYTSDEQGIRHALLDEVSSRVGQDEAIFMLSACASFASYLWHKHAEGARS